MLPKVYVLKPLPLHPQSVTAFANRPLMKRVRKPEMVVNILQGFKELRSENLKFSIILGYLVRLPKVHKFKD